MTKNLKQVRDKNKTVRREALREELKSREYIRQIHGILEKEDWADKVPEYNGKLNGYFKLLSKTLPDLKAVEIELNGNVSFESEYLNRLIDAATSTDE